MIICKESKTCIKNFIVEIIVISILCTVFQFTYEFTGRNIVIAFFSAVNESVLEHIKRCVIATYIVALVKMGLNEDREGNLWISLFFRIISLLILIPMFIGLYKFFVGYEILAFDILIFYISIVISQCIEFKIIQLKKVSRNTEEVMKYINIFLIITSAILTIIKIKSNM